MSQKITQEQLELQSDISKNQIGNIERGEINTSIFTIKKIAEALNVHPRELLNFDMNEKSVKKRS